MIHPDTALCFIDDTVGHGVVATRFIPRGTIVWALDRFDQVFSPSEVAGFGDLHKQMIARYGYYDGHGNTILCWDHGRFVNHSCEPTCLSPGYNFEIAARDIHPGEQLTDDYSSLNLAPTFFCRCGSPSCRGTVRAEDFDQLAPAWDRTLSEVFPLIPTVEQPLWSLVEDPAAVVAACTGQMPMASSARHRWAAK